MIEHRWSQRVSADVAVQIIDVDHKASRGIIRNLSQFGVYVEAPNPYTEHAFLHLRFILPNGKGSDEREIGAVVIHSNSRGMGMMVDTTVAGAAQTMRELKRCYGCGLFPRQRLVAS